MVNWTKLIKTGVIADVIKWTGANDIEIANFCPEVLFCFTDSIKLTAAQRGHRLGCFKLLRPIYLEIPSSVSRIRVKSGDYIIRTVYGDYIVTSRLFGKVEKHHE